MKISIADLVDLDPESGMVIVKMKNGAHLELSVKELIAVCDAYILIVSQLQREAGYATIH